jgi:xanthine/CO dehydrogenase XdhC/CoxF family maturation factor
VYSRNGQCLTPRPRRLVWKGGVVTSTLDDDALLRAVTGAFPAGGFVPPSVTVIETREGKFEVLLEQLRPAHALVLVGVSAVSLALANFGAQLGWQVTLVDPRVDSPPPPGIPQGVQFRQIEPQRMRDHISLDAFSSVVVMSHKLETDIACLVALKDAPVGYLGAIGSRARVERIFEATTLTAARLHAPAGLDVGSETPEEIALSIAAEIVAVAAGRSGGALSAVDTPIH